MTELKIKSKIETLIDLIYQDLKETSDEEIIKEAIEDGIDVDKVCKEFEELIHKLTKDR